MSPDQYLELTVEKLAPGGLGLARLNGEVIFLPGTLPGETLRAELEPRRRGVRRGRVIEVLRASPQRVEPDCPWAGRCGGCDFLHVQPAAALGLKAEAALGELAGRAGIELELLESPRAEGYRARAVLHLGPDQSGRLTAGFLPAQGRDGGPGLIVFDDCRLLSPALAELAAPLRAWAAGLPPDFPPFDLSLAAGLAGSGRMIVLAPPPRLTGGPGQRRSKSPAANQFSKERLAAAGPDFARLPLILKERGLSDVSVFIQDRPGGRPGRVSPDGPDRLVTADWPQWDLRLAAAPGGFSQVNPDVNQLMVEKIRQLAAPLAAAKAPRALDLYSGLGNIALPLARAGFNVTAVEEAPAGAAAARQNAGDLKNFTVINGRSQSAAADLAARGRTFDLIVLDPPRSGAPGLAPTLAALKPGLIIYLACHPAVLPRDLPAFASLGFRLRSLTALDMFPRTSHLEALAVLDRP